MKRPDRNTESHDDSHDESGRSENDPGASDLSTPENGRAPNPPRTTKGKWTAPKFGSAGSGGAELEPGPEKD